MAKSNIEILPISQVKENSNNPRFIKDEKFKKLVQSIKEFPEMLKLRPLVIDENNIVLGGNMRLKACKELKIKEVPVVYAKNLSEKQKSEFIIKDNVGFGDWDWDILANEWDSQQLEDWGLDIPKENDVEIDEVEPSENNSWFLNIEFESEKDVQKWYEKLTEQGLICKIVQ